MEVEHDTLLFRKLLMKQKESSLRLTNRPRRHQPTTAVPIDQPSVDWIGFIFQMQFQSQPAFSQLVALPASLPRPSSMAELKLQHGL